MPTGPAKTADEIADSIKSMIDRLVDADITKQAARQGQNVAGMIAERGAELGERAADVWDETRPARKDAAKLVAGATNDAAKWSDQTWRDSLRPALKDLWKRRTLAIGAAGAAVPAGRELLDTAAVRLGLREREREEERRRWGVFFLGLALGAVAGVVAALLTAPKRGSEMRRELGVRADEMRRELGVKADEIATKARESEWMPVFQRNGDERVNGHAAASMDALGEASSNLDTAAAEGGAASGEAADVAASDAADAINESYDTVDRETPA